MRRRNMSYTGLMLDVEPQVHHHPEHGMVPYGGATSFRQPYNTPTILPPPRNFDPHYLPENHGHLPYVITQYNREPCNTFMIPSPSGGVFSVPVNSHLVHGGQSVQAVPIPWLDQLTWNRSHGVPFLLGGIENMGLHGSQIPAMSRNSMPLMHPRPVRPPHGSHNIYHPPPTRPPPLPPVQVQNMDIHLQSTSTSHSNHTGTSNSNPFQNGIDSGPSSVPIPPPPPPSPGLRDYEAHHRELTIGFTLGHHSFGHLRVLPQDELLALGEQIGRVDSGLLDDFISNHLRTRTFSNLEDVALGVEEPNLCVICQMEFEDQEKIGMLDCWHEYHEECIKKWLIVKNNCPICKSTALA